MVRHHNHDKDFAKNIILSEDGLGLSYLLYTDAEFLATFGHAPIRKPHPGAFQGGALEQRNIQLGHDEHILHEDAKAYFTMEPPGS